jgi:hypothetical protein
MLIVLKFLKIVRSVHSYVSRVGLSGFVTIELLILKRGSADIFNCLLLQDLYCDHRWTLRRHSRMHRQFMTKLVDWLVSREGGVSLHIRSTLHRHHVQYTGVSYYARRQTMTSSRICEENLFQNMFYTDGSDEATNQPKNWLTDWPTDRPTDRPTDQPTNQLTNRIFISPKFLISFKDILYAHE